MPLPVVHNITAILFDMNGTLRVREPHEPTRQAATSRLLQLLGKEDASPAYWEELSQRYQAYSRWAQENLIQLSEGEIWSRWILPEYPPEQIEPVAAELTLVWSERKGRTVPRPEAEQTLVELKQRGYRLGIISNTMSTLDIPRSLEACGWKGYFDVVVLSSVTRYRKPSPEPFLEAARQMSIEPACCAYLGNRIAKDMPGCKRAGFALGIVLEPPGSQRTEEIELSVRPDLTIYSLNDLLQIFPQRGGQNEII